jgi:hypothetical protein
MLNVKQLLYSLHTDLRVLLHYAVVLPEPGLDLELELDLELQSGRLLRCSQIIH